MNYLSVAVISQYGHHGLHAYMYMAAYSHKIENHVIVYVLGVEESDKTM